MVKQLMFCTAYAILLPAGVVMFTLIGALAGLTYSFKLVFDIIHLMFTAQEGKDAASK